MHPGHYENYTDYIPPKRKTKKRNSTRRSQALYYNNNYEDPYYQQESNDWLYPSPSSSYTTLPPYTYDPYSSSNVTGLENYVDAMNLMDNDHEQPYMNNNDNHHHSNNPYKKSAKMKLMYDNIYPITGMDPSLINHQSSPSSRLSEPSYIPHMGIPPMVPPTSSSSFDDHMIYYNHDSDNHNNHNNNSNINDYHPGYGSPHHFTRSETMKHIKKKRSANLSRSNSIGTTNPYHHEYYANHIDHTNDNNNNNNNNNNDNVYIDLYPPDNMNDIYNMNEMYNMNMPPPPTLPPPFSQSYQQQNEGNNPIHHYFHAASAPNSPNLGYNDNPPSSHLPSDNESMLLNRGLRRSTSMHEAFLPSDMPPSMMNSNLPPPNLQRRHSLFEFDHHQPSPDMNFSGNSAPSTPWMAPIELQQQQQSLNNPNLPPTNIDFTSHPPPLQQQQQQQQQDQLNQPNITPHDQHKQNQSNQQNQQNDIQQQQGQQQLNNDMMSTIPPLSSQSSFFSQSPNPMMHQSMQPPLPPTSSMMTMPTPPPVGMMGMNGLHQPPMGNMPGPHPMNMMTPWDPMMMGGGPRPPLPPFGFPGDPMNMMNPMGMMGGPMMGFNNMNPLSQEMMMNGEKENKNKDDKKDKKEKDKKVSKEIEKAAAAASTTEKSIPVVTAHQDPLPPLAKAATIAAAAAAVGDIKSKESKEIAKEIKKEEKAAAAAASGEPIPVKDIISDEPATKLKRKSSIWNSLFGGITGGGIGGSNYRYGGPPMMSDLDYARRYMPMSFMQQPHMIDGDFHARGMVDNSKLNEKIEQFNRLPFVWCYLSPVNLSLTYWCAFKINNQRKLNHALNNHHRAVTLDKERTLPGTVIVNPLSRSAVLYKNLWSTSKMPLRIMRLSHEEYIQYARSLSPHLIQKYAPKGPMIPNNSILKSFVSDVVR